MRVVDWEALRTRFGRVFVVKLDCGHMQLVAEHDAREQHAVCLECENRAARTEVERMAARVELMAARVEFMAANVRDAVRRG